MRIPKAIEKLSESFEALPGIGPKSAQRLTFYLLHVPQIQLDTFSQNLINLKDDTKMCSICQNIGDTEICSVCTDNGRDSGIICVVEDPMDVVALEKGGRYKGVYHVLHGVIDPLNSMGPDDIFIPQLLERMKSEDTHIKEIILATNPTMEGEATAMYITREIKRQNENLPDELQVRVTRIGHGLPVGADLEYADEITLQRALEGRREY